MLHKVWKWLHLRKRSHNRILPARLCSEGRCSPTQRLVSWSNPVVPKVWVETQTKVEKGQKMSRAEAGQTAAEYFQRYFCFSVSVCIGTWAKGRWLTLKMNLATCYQKSSIKLLFFHTFFEVWVGLPDNLKFFQGLLFFKLIRWATFTLSTSFHVWASQAKLNMYEIEPKQNDTTVLEYFTFHYTTFKDGTSLHIILFIYIGYSWFLNVKCNQ